MTPLKSFAPSDSFSLTVTIADDSDFQFAFRDSETRTLRAFRSGVPGKPKIYYGNWSGLIKSKDKNTGSAQQGDPAAGDKPPR